MKKDDDNLIDEHSIVAFHLPIIAKKGKKVLVVRGIARLKDDKDTVVFIGAAGEPLAKIEKA